jgi:hypothetical protein
MSLSVSQQSPSITMARLVSTLRILFDDVSDESFSSRQRPVDGMRSLDELSPCSSKSSDGMISVVKDTAVAVDSGKN